MFPAESEHSTSASRWSDLAAVTGVLTLIVVAAATAMLLDDSRASIRADAAPLLGQWDTNLTWQSVPAILVALLVIAYGPALAARLRWPTLLMTGWVTSTAWIVTLGLVDGWERMTSRLIAPHEYLAEVPQAPPVADLLTVFTERIASSHPDAWVSHVAGHPPGALLFFVGLDAVGLGGGTRALATVILLGGSACVAVAMALRALDTGRGGERLARRALPFLVLAPAAIWIGASADGMFLAVSAWGITLLTIATKYRGLRMVAAAALAGLLLGFSVYLSYGLLLMGPIAVAVLIAAWRLAPGLVTAGTSVAVAATFTLAGFAWWEGLDQLVIRYHEGWGGDRPYGYWVWANLASLALCAGLAVAPGLRRVVAGTYQAARMRMAPAPGRGAVTLALGATAAVIAATLSGLSKAEVERVWLPFALWLVPACALLPWRDHRWWLALQALTALLVKHLISIGG